MQFEGDIGQCPNHLFPETCKPMIYADQVLQILLMYFDVGAGLRMGKAGPICFVSTFKQKTRFYTGF